MKPETEENKDKGEFYTRKQNSVTVDSVVRYQTPECPSEKKSPRTRRAKKVGNREGEKESRCRRTGGDGHQRTEVCDLNGHVFHFSKYL